MKNIFKEQNRSLFLKGYDANLYYYIDPSVSDELNICLINVVSFNILILFSQRIR